MTPHPDEGALHAFIDGELSAGESAALEAHVAECGSCAAALAEARGIVAGASRAISALDAAPASASRPVVAPVDTVPSARPSSRPFVFRVPFARAAALLLLAGGSAVVINRSTSGDGATSSAESLSGDAVLAEEGAIAEQTTQAVPRPTSNAAPPLAAPTTGTVRSARGVDAEAGAVAQKQAVTLAAPAAPVPAVASVTNDGNAASGAMPRPPARMAASEATSLPSVAPVARVTRYRTRGGVILTLTEEPLGTAFAEESAADRRGAARPMAQASALVVNSYRWSSAELGKSFMLTGSLSVAELEAASKRLGELERVP